MSSEQKLCLACQKPVNGRSDKKFCDDYCRNAHHNRLKSDSYNYIRRVNNTLLKNRKILASLLPESQKRTKVKEDSLRSLGFRFDCHTHTHITKGGRLHVFSYEYGYVVLEDNRYLLVRKPANLLNS